MMWPVEGRTRIATLACLAILVAACVAGPTPSPPVATDSAPGVSEAPAPTATPEPGSRKRIVVDTDVAPDDLVAIASMVRDPSIELLAITVAGTGEAHCQGGLFVVRSVVTMLLDQPIPVACGRSTPLGDAEPFPDEWRAGADAGSGLDLVSPGFAPDDRAAAELLVELATAESDAGRRLTILTLGPVTNLASALELDPALPARVTEVSRAGAVSVAGNVMTGDAAAAPVAEWNAHADPTALRRVVEAGFDLTLIPLDATNDVPLTGDLHAALESDHAAGPADLVFELWAGNPYMTGGGFYLWDPLAAAAMRDPSIVTTRDATLRVEEGAGPEGGRLVESASGAKVTIATGADRARFEPFLLERLRLGPPREHAFVTAGTVVVDAGDGTCAARLDPPNARAGRLRFEAANSSAEPVSVFAFAVGSTAWADIVAFAADPRPDLASPPPVQEIRWIDVPAGSHGGWYGTAPAGEMGVACLFGSFEAPEILLVGPITIAP